MSKISHRLFALLIVCALTVLSSSAEFAGLNFAVRPQMHGPIQATRFPSEALAAAERFFKDPRHNLPQPNIVGLTGDLSRLSRQDAPSWRVKKLREWTEDIIYLILRLG